MSKLIDHCFELCKPTHHILNYKWGNIFTTGGDQDLLNPACDCVESTFIDGAHIPRVMPAISVESLSSFFLGTQVSHKYIPSPHAELAGPRADFSNAGGLFVQLGVKSRQIFANCSRPGNALGRKVCTF